jgi:type I restriction enzyme S subunit
MTSEINIERTDHLKDVGLQNLPNDWSIVEIKDLLEKDRGISVGVMYPGTHDPLGIPLIKVGDLTRNTISKNLEFYISPEKHYEYRRTALEGGELLLTLVGALGHCAIVPDSIAGWNVARAIAVLRLKKDIDANFVRLCLLSPPLQHLINTWANTSVQATINLKEVKQLPIPYPPSKERENIVQFITCIEQKIENLRRQNETLEQIAQTLFKNWFIDFEFPNVDDKPYKSSGGAIIASELGDIPEGWKFSAIGDEVETVGGGTPLTTELSYWENGDIPWYSPTDLTKAKTLFSIDSEKKITKLGLQKSSARLFPKYSLLLTSRATIGELTINTKEACTNQGFITIIPNTKFSVYFLYGWLLTKIRIIKQLASGSTFPEISKTNFRCLDFLIPESNILEKHEQLTKPIYKKIETNIFQIQTLTKTRDSLLPKLMSGQIRVKA